MFYPPLKPHAILRIIFNFFVCFAFLNFHFNQILLSMRRLSFKIADHEKELFGGHYEGQERLQLSRFSFDTVPSSLSSSSKSRRSFCRNSSSASTALSNVSSRKSFSYDKLDRAPIHLTVVKLDGSSFEIKVVKVAKISDLKQAVESAFNHLPTTGPEKISWRHVWTHFCLSYCGQKLLDDDDYIKYYGIRDGDELHFVQHVSIAYNLIKKIKKTSRRIGCCLSQNMYHFP